MKSTKSTGFTLIELVIVIAILAIIVSLALPSYTSYIFRQRRADGKELLMRIASAQERNYTNFNRYAASVTGAAPGGLGFASGGDTTKDGTYTVTIASADPFQTYTLTATPVGRQAPDKCKALIIDNTGKKSNGVGWSAANGACW